MTNHPNRTKVYPDKTLEDAMRAAGIEVHVSWKLRGPPNTDVAWIVCYQMGPGCVIVETLKNGVWSEFLDGDANFVRDSVDRIVAAR